MPPPDKITRILAEQRGIKEERALDRAVRRQKFIDVISFCAQPRKGESIMTRLERMRRATRQRKALWAIFLGVVVLVAVGCTNFGGRAEADNNIENVQEPSAKQTLYQEQLPQPVVDVDAVLYIEEIEHTPVEALDLHIAAEEVEPDTPYTEKDVIALAQMTYGEAFITRSDTEMSACMWCACNRLDSGDRFYAGCESVYDIVTQRNQFYGYDEDNPVDEHLVWLARDVLDRWAAEHNGSTDVGRTLPKEYCFFMGDGLHNHFTTEHMGGIEYDWSLPSPYES